MPIKDVCSPITTGAATKGFGPGSGPPMSPGARSAPGRASGDSVPKQPAHAASTHQEPQPQEPQLRAERHRASHQEDPIPGSTPVTIGPEE
jgi:hypothetical protein